MFGFLYAVSVCKHRRGEVPFAGIGQKRHDDLACVFRTLCKLCCRKDCRAGGDAHQNTLAACQRAAGRKRVLILHGENLISNLGILISVLSIFGLLYALISHLCGVTVAGWTAIVASIWLLGGLQMLCLGVVGGYIGKIYSEVKQRPRFLIETHLKAESEEKVLDEH